MQDRALYSIQEARRLLGGISRNTIYRLLRSGELASVVIGCRRFIAPASIAELVAKSTTNVSPSLASTRSRLTAQTLLPLPLPTSSRKRPEESGIDLMHSGFSLGKSRDARHLRAVAPKALDSVPVTPFGRRQLNVPLVQADPTTRRRNSFEGRIAAVNQMADARIESPP
jgi:excisionase family DNA binding protein